MKSASYFLSVGAELALIILTADFSRTLSIFTVAIIAAATPVLAQIVTDGTVGLGTRVGTNLFHSFRDFNINTGETATFTGPSGISNVISRVTGGAASGIDGLLASTIPGANFWFLNPAGVMFGPNARLSLPASLYVAAADHIQFQDGGRFSASLSTVSSLVASPPQAFGFLGGATGNIDVKAGRLIVSTGSTLSLAGVDVHVDAGGAGTLRAPMGQVNLYAVGTAPNTVDLARATGSNEFSGTLTIADTHDANKTVNVSGNGAGLIRLRAGDVKIEGGFLYSDNSGSLSKVQAIDITARTLSLSNGGLLSADAQGRGGAGSITITADNIRVTDGGLIRSEVSGSGAGGRISITTKSLTIDGKQLDDTITGVSVDTSGAGAGGVITIKTDSLRLVDGGTITADSYESSGRGGRIDITAQSVTIDSVLDFITAISADTLGPGAGGSINIEADTLAIYDGGGISSAAFDAGAGGDITITAKKLTIDGMGNTTSTGISVRSGNRNVPAGDAGHVSVTADDLRLYNGGFISGSTYGSGGGGQVRIAAKTLILDGTGVDGRGNDDTGIFSTTQGVNPGAGSAGSVTVTAGDLQILNDAEIGTNSLGTGAGGRVSISAKTLLIDNMGATFGTGIFASAGGQGLISGVGGNVNVTSDDIQILDGGEIASLSTGPGASGDVNVSAKTLTIDGTGTSAATGVFSNSEGLGAVSGAAGAVGVTADFLMLFKGGSIGSSSFGTGVGGGVIVTAKSLTISDMNSATATGIFSNAQGTSDAAGSAGEVKVTADDLQILNGGEISSLSTGSGAGGQVDVTAKNLNIDGAGSLSVAGIFANSQGTGAAGGAAGSVGVHTDILTLANRGEISSSTYGSGAGGVVMVSARSLTIDGRGGPDTGIYTTSASRSQGSGAGGSIRVMADMLEMRGGGEISSLSKGSGAAGTINVSVNKLLSLRASSITTTTSTADGGQIGIDATAVYMNNAEVASTVGGEDGTAGNIALHTSALVLDASNIAANAVQGDGGNILMTASNIFQRGGVRSLIQASSERGVDGTVSLYAPNIDSSTGIVALSLTFTDTADLFSQTCTARSAGASSSLISAGKRGLPSTSDQFGSSPLFVGSAPPSAMANADVLSQARLITNNRALGCY